MMFECVFQSAKKQKKQLNENEENYKGNRE
jgi:hypothetical protein